MSILNLSLFGVPTSDASLCRSSWVSVTSSSSSASWLVDLCGSTGFRQGSPGGRRRCDGARLLRAAKTLLRERWVGNLISRLRSEPTLPTWWTQSNSSTVIGGLASRRKLQKASATWNGPRLDVYNNPKIDLSNNRYYPRTWYKCSILFHIALRIIAEPELIQLPKRCQVGRILAHLGDELSSSAL